MTSFATLLRHSKPLHLDPSIPQVLVSYAGHAHRSEFGLKRPLPSVRDPTIRVQSIDTHYRQTEFVAGEKERRFIRGIEESGIAFDSKDVDVETERPKRGEVAGACEWDQQSFISVDQLRQLEAERKGAQAKESSEAAAPGVGKPNSSPEMSANQQAIYQPQVDYKTPGQYKRLPINQFDKYVDSLTAERKAFQKYVRDRLSSNTSNKSEATSNMLRIATSRDAHAYVNDFFTQAQRDREGKEAGNPTAQFLKSFPNQHPTRGLTYASPAPVYLKRAFPARVLPPADKHPKVAVLGVIASNTGLIGQVPPTAYTDDIEGTPPNAARGAIKVMLDDTMIISRNEEQSNREQGDKIVEKPAKTILDDNLIRLGCVKPIVGPRQPTAPFGTPRWILETLYGRHSVPNQQQNQESMDTIAKQTSVLGDMAEMYRDQGQERARKVPMSGDMAADRFAGYSRSRASVKIPVKSDTESLLEILKKATKASSS